MLFLAYPRKKRFLIMADWRQGSDSLGKESSDSLGSKTSKLIPSDFEGLKGRKGKRGS